MLHGTMYEGGIYYPFWISIVLFSIPLAIGCYKVAERLGREKALWAILSLVPVVNYFFWIYVWFVVVLYVLDRLKAIETGLPAARG